MTHLCLETVAILLLKGGIDKQQHRRFTQQRMLGLNETQHSERWVKTDQLFYIADNVSLKCVVTFVTHQEASAVTKTTLLVNLELVLMPIFYYCFSSVLLFTRFPTHSVLEEEKQWRFIKSKINSKCRGQKFAQQRLN